MSPSFAPTHYQPPETSIWKGREDFPNDASTHRWHHLVKPLNLTAELQPNRNNPVVLLGFCSDEGVIRNGGRPGAKSAPHAIRNVLTNLPVHDSLTIYDAGNIICDDRDLESCQQSLSEAISRLVTNGYRPIVMGGGHEVAKGHGLGLLDYLDAKKSRKRLGIINFDAHFDLRPVTNGSTSGTPFLELYQASVARKLPFSYFCLGIQKIANTRHLFDTAQKIKTQWIEADHLRDTSDLSKAKIKLRPFLKKCDFIYLSLCLDVIAAAFAPGVSAPAPLGILPHILLELMRFVLASKKVLAFDIAELSPPFDMDGKTARLAAQLIWEFVHYKR